MKSDIVTAYYRPLLEQNHFRAVPCPEKFSAAGSCWQIAPEVGSGYYWVYAKQDLFDIKIHDFFFHEDQCLDMNIPACISIQCYDSISGEELNPYRRLSAGDIQTIVGGKPRYRALIHKRIPIHAVGVEILPGYYEEFLKKQYPDIYFDLPAAFQSVVSYIADHYAFELPLERLASIACMSESKLKSCFRRQFGCSVTQYIQGWRMSQAEHLLIGTDFTMGQIAQMIGYTTSGRFAELFRKSTGILPVEYRRIARKDGCGCK